MVTVDESWLLRAWEAAGAVPRAARGAVFATEAGVTPDLDAALDLPVAGLTVLLARLYAEQFGPTAAAVLDCTACGLTLDVQVPVESVTADDGGAQVTGQVTNEVTTTPGRRWSVRVPTTRDLLAAREEPDVVSALLARCVSDPDAHHSAGTDVQADPVALTADAGALDAALAELAGAAAATVEAHCPECGATTSAAVDIATFLSASIDRDAPSLLAEIADIAAVFGWSEAEILRLGRARRTAYLALVRGERP
ncbi:hypothetical protein ACO0LV_09920 [Pseudactinotalea sp. Z1739]|uniref:hypothetical protein n=1 Tax=Pseudactinotalea sp. Z1739 TaxID=3413028 RepID=UPI003C7C4A6F